MTVIVSPFYQREVLAAEAPVLAAAVDEFWSETSTGFEPRCEMPTAKETIELFKRTEELLRTTNAAGVPEAEQTIWTLLRTQRAEAIDLAHGEIKSAHAFVKEAVLSAANESTTQLGTIMSVVHSDANLSKECITRLNAALAALRMAESISGEAYALPYR